MSYQMLDHLRAPSAEGGCWRPDDSIETRDTRRDGDSEFPVFVTKAGHIRSPDAQGLLPASRLARYSGARQPSRRSGGAGLRFGPDHHPRKPVSDDPLWYKD